MIEKPFAGGQWLLIVSSDPRLCFDLISQFEGRLEIVHILTDRIIKRGQRLTGDDARESIISNKPTDNGPVLLFDPGLVVFPIRLGTL